MFNDCGSCCSDTEGGGGELSLLADLGLISRSTLRRLRRLRDIGSELRNILRNVLSNRQETVIALRTGQLFTIPGTNFTLMPIVQGMSPLTALFHLFDGSNTMMVPVQRLRNGLSWTLTARNLTIQFTFRGICRSGLSLPQNGNLGASLNVNAGQCGNTSSDDDQNVGNTSNSSMRSLWLLIGIQIQFQTGYLRNLLRDLELNHRRKGGRSRRRNSESMFCCC